ncbi:hypothetical protein L6452_27146 [Arctium lappa]|uniref:Uncharacterized protein n=1 Tax=Arctium lappa TaxID=4217 RepID=A0ACB8ZVU8_ARCLA|nr:hypothetical protein L6452_27146 [Arctium lappa]
MIPSEDESDGRNRDRSPVYAMRKSVPPSVYCFHPLQNSDDKQGSISLLPSNRSGTPYLIDLTSSFVLLFPLFSRWNPRDDRDEDLESQIEKAKASIVVLEPNQDLAPMSSLEWDKNPSL